MFPPTSRRKCAAAVCTFSILPRLPGSRARSGWNPGSSERAPYLMATFVLTSRSLNRRQLFRGVAYPCPRRPGPRGGACTGSARKSASSLEHTIFQAAEDLNGPEASPKMVADPSEFTTPTSPSLTPRAVPHVDGAAWPCHLRVAPSRTSPGSAIKSQNPSFEGPAPRDRPLRRGIIPPRRAGERRDGFTRRLLALL